MIDVTHVNTIGIGHLPGHLGIVVTQVGKGEVRAELAIQPHHLAPNGYLFELWMMMGGLMAAPIFASSVITMPLLLDRRVDVLQAVLAVASLLKRNPHEPERVLRQVDRRKIERAERAG